jgi:hypothetical protein
MASSETIESRRKVAIERAHSLTPKTFHQRYLSGYGQPVIITNAVSTWKAWGWCPASPRPLENIPGHRDHRSDDRDQLIGIIPERVIGIIPES